MTLTSDVRNPDLPRVGAYSDQEDEANRPRVKRIISVSGLSNFTRVEYDDDEDSSLATALETMVGEIRQCFRPGSEEYEEYAAYCQSMASRSRPTRCPAFL